MFLYLFLSVLSQTLVQDMTVPDSRAAPDMKKEPADLIFLTEKLQDLPSEGDHFLKHHQ